MTKANWIQVGAVAIAVAAGTLAVRQTSAQCCGGGPAPLAAKVEAPAGSQPASGPASQPAEGKAKFVNARCPIMGGVIDPAKVPDALTRDYNGQKVAFCCGGCPAAWDKLAPAEKDAKLKAVASAK